MKSFYVCSTNENSDYLPSCFICGFKRSGAYSVFLRQNGQPGPYFPFLETHDPPEGADLPTSDGKVLSCYTCYAFLYQQWESYERDKVPPVKRIYWLKRVDGGPYTGVELGMQSEYASQVFGLTSDHCNQNDIQKNFDIRSRYDASSPKDVSKSEFDVASLEHEKPSISSDLLNVDPHEQHEALDLSIEKRGKKREHEDSESIDDSPQVLDLSLPDQDSGTEACYICGMQVNAETLHAIYAVITPPYICGPHFQNIQFHPRAGGSVPIKRNGTVSACLSCTSRLFALWNIYQKQNVPHNKRNYFFKTSPSNFEELKCCKCLNPLESEYRPQLDHTVKMGPNPLENALIVELAFMCKPCHEISLEIIGWKKSESNDSVYMLQNSSADGLCAFCKKSTLNTTLHTVSFVAMFDSNFYFPNMYNFVPPRETFTTDGRILACSGCFSTSLQQIWEKPVFPDVESSFRNNSNVLIQNSVLPKSKDYKDEKNIYKTLYPKYDCESPAKDSSQICPITSQMPLKRAAICYICGHYCKINETFATSDKKIGTNPFFPFLCKYPSPYKESIIENSNYLLCQFCFHSLTAQYKSFERQAPESHLRVYDTHRYVCFVCSTKTYRKRLHIIHVKDYPFLKEHTPATGGMVINNGQSVIVCKDCHTSLSDQYTEAERVGIPVEKRQYNWIQRPPPPQSEFENLFGREMLKTKGFSSQGGLSNVKNPSTSSLEAKHSPYFSKGRLSPSMIPLSTVKDISERGTDLNEKKPLDLLCLKEKAEMMPQSPIYQAPVEFNQIHADRISPTTIKNEKEENCRF